MRVVRSASLILLAISFGLVQGPELLAAQRPAEMALYGGEMEHFLSPTEMQLAELQRERQDLLKSRENEKSARILKNKITILNNKIAYLQRQIKLTRPYVVKQRLVPIRVKGAAADAEPSPASMAWTPNVTQPKPVAEVARRLQAAEAPVPVSLEAKKFMASTSRESAATQTLPVKMAYGAFGASAPRQIPASQALPVKAEMKPLSSPSVRLAAEERAVSAKPTLKAPAHLKPGSGKTGADWKKMALPDKEIYILSVMGNLSRRDVYLMKPYSYYIQSIDQAIEKDPLLEKELVHRILMTAAYESEPDTRKDLEKVWQ